MSITTLVFGEKIITGITQGSILGPLLFNIFINLVFFVSGSYLSNYIADNTLYASGFNLEKVKKYLAY